MNEELIKFIELCLMDGVVSDKEREVIFRKSKELGVPDDECEIILEGMIHKNDGVFQTKKSFSNSFTEKKPKLIKRKVLNKQVELETSISNNDSMFVTIEKQKRKLEEELNQCLSLEVVKNNNLGETISSYKSYDELLKILKDKEKKIKNGKRK
jgi:hypothetical protein